MVTVMGMDMDMEMKVTDMDTGMATVMVMEKMIIALMPSINMITNKVTDTDMAMDMAIRI